MNIKFSKCNFSNVLPEMSSYFTSRDILVDSFWEDLVISSNHYQIKFDDQIIGFCSVQKQRTLTTFAVSPKFAHMSQDIFFKARKLEFVSSALVTTGDELFMSLALDTFNSFENDAYFTRSNNEKLEMRNSLKLTVASFDNLEMINKLTDYFWEKSLSKMIEEENFYLAFDNSELVGFGHIEPGIIATDKSSVGMYVCCDKRCKGYGSEILIGLKNIILKEGKEPIAGCWYLNHNSLKAQIKAGQYSKTRMIKFKY